MTEPTARPAKLDSYTALRGLGDAVTPRLSTGELERRVLEALWAGDGGMTPRQVHDVLGAERDLAYTTVMTILVRLWQKGLATRVRDGRAYRYAAVTSREELTAERMRQLLDNATDSNAALTHFVDGLDTKGRAQLRKLLGRPKR